MSRTRFSPHFYSLMIFGLLLLFGANSNVFAGSESTSPVYTIGVDEVITIKAYGSALEYDQTEIRAEAGSTITIRFDNSESTMPHNVVFVQEESDVRPVSIAGMRAHGNEYIPEDEYERIIAYTSMAGPGEVVEVTFEVPPAGEYPFVCTYPGHFQTMQGVLVSVDSN